VGWDGLDDLGVAPDENLPGETGRVGEVCRAIGNAQLRADACATLEGRRGASRGRVRGVCSGRAGAIA
jgi:hypothetical protein